MGSILAKVAFTAFGKPVTIKAILLSILGILLAIGLFFAFRFINGYFQHIKEIESQNAQLQQQVGQLTEQKKQVVQVNHDNDRVSTTNNQIHEANQNIATEERHASQQRSAQYKEISHAIQSAPSQPQPVSPVITDTLDRLWGPAPKDGK